MDIKEIEDEIRKLEKSDTTYANLQKLAWLYTARNNMSGLGYDGKTLPKFESKSEFIQACSNSNVVEFMKILDEHMEVIKALYPKEYDEIIRRISKA